MTAFCAASSSGGAAAAEDLRLEALPPEADAPAPRLAAAEPFLAAGEAGAGEGLAGVGAGAGAAAAALSDEGSARPEGLEVGGAAAAQVVPQRKDVSGVYSKVQEGWDDEKTQD